MNEVERKIRVEFAKILARDHGVSAVEDEELIEGLWANLDGEDISYACAEPKTGVRDLLADALKSQLYQYYMSGKRGSGLGASQSDDKGTSTRREIEGLEDLLDGGGAAPDNKLKATTKARVAALSEYLSRIVAADKSVALFRDRVLGDPTATLSVDDANNLIHSLAAQQQPGPRRDAQTLWWSGNDKLPGAEPIMVWPGSELWNLHRITNRLVKRYPWSEDQICYLILTGLPIAAATLKGAVSTHATGVAAHRYHHATITLTVDSWIPSEYVRRAYHDAQRDYYGENVRQPELRNVELFRFVVARSKLEVVNREEGLVKLAIPQQRWKELRELWNKVYPDGHDWHYDKKREHRFSRDFYRGQEAVIGTNYGLPGVPGQPITVDEAKAGVERMLEDFARPSAVFVEVTDEEIS